MSNLTTFANAGLPAVSNIASSLRKLDAGTGAAGTAILKMDRTGHWVFGADQTEVEDGSTWAINPYSFVHGYIAWGDGEVLGEKMVSVAEPLPEMEPAPSGAKKGWEKQVGLNLKCVSGDDEGLEVRYSTTSVGGVKAVQAIAVAIANQVDKDASKPVAVVTLEKDHYQHKSYGRIYTPVFEVQEWMSMDGAASEESDEAEAYAEEAEEVVEAPRRRRRAV